MIITKQKIKVEESNFLFSQATDHTMLIMIALQIKNDIHLNQGYDSNHMQQTDILESLFYFLIKIIHCLQNVVQKIVHGPNKF